MIESLTYRRRPAWLTNLLAFALVLASSTMLLYVCRNGPPSRSSMGVVVSILLVTPVLMRWHWGWTIMFLYSPFGAFIRRVYALYQPGKEGGNDPLTILPDILMMVTLLGYLATLRHARTREALWGTRPLSAAIVLLIVLCFIEVFNPAMNNITAGMNGLRMFTLWIMLYFVAPIVIDKREKLYHWIYASLGIGAITGLYGAYQYIYDFPVWDKLWAEQNNVTTQAIGDQMRAFSTFTFTSTFSQYMVITIIMATTCLQMKRIGLFVRMLSPFFMACMLLGLAVTFVRSSYLGLLLAWVVGLVVAGKGRGRLIRMAAVVIIGGALVSILPHSQGEGGGYVDPDTQSTSNLVADRMLSLAEPTRVGTVSIRTTIWQRVITDATFNYPAGVGLGAGNTSRFGSSVDNYWVSAAAYTESQVFSILAEMGWAGLFLYLFIIGYGLLYSLRIYDLMQEPDDKRIVQMMIMIQVGISTAGVSGGPILYTLPGSCFYWAALGVVCAMARMENLTQARFKRDGGFHLQAPAEPS